MQDLQSLVRKRQPLKHASRLEVRCSALKWQLLSAERREAMVTTAIGDLSLSLSRNQDLSGAQSTLLSAPPHALVAEGCLRAYLLTVSLSRMSVMHIMLIDTHEAIA